jgi:hypothetical protein
VNVWAAWKRCFYQTRPCSKRAARAPQITKNPTDHLASGALNWAAVGLRLRQWDMGRTAMFTSKQCNAALRFRLDLRKETAPVRGLGSRDRSTALPEAGNPAVAPGMDRHTWRFIKKLPSLPRRLRIVLNRPVEWRLPSPDGATPPTSPSIWPTGQTHRVIKFPKSSDATPDFVSHENQASCELVRQCKANPRKPIAG